MGYRLNHLDEPVSMAVSKPLLTEFRIHHRLESCESVYRAASDLLQCHKQLGGQKYSISVIYDLCAFMAF